MRIVSVRSVAIDVGFQKQSLQTTRIASPMSRWPHYAQSRSRWTWPTRKTIVRIESADGLVGWSSTSGGEVSSLIIEQHLSRLIVGQDVSSISDIPDIWDQMFASLLPVDRSGFAMMAIAGTDIALWDLLAKTKQMPLVELLGGSKNMVMPAYITGSDPTSHADVGWWGFKAAIPYAEECGEEGFDRNVALVERMRRAVGDEQRIMIDAFMAWNADYALRFVDKTGEYDLFWIEDPIPPYDLEGLHRIKRQADGLVRIALGNFCFNRFDCQQIIGAGLVDVLQPDVAWAGGITECLRIIEIADAAGIPVILHNSCEQPWAGAIAAARQKQPVLEFVDRGPRSELYGLMGDAMSIEAGQVTVPADREGHMPPVRIISAFES